MADIWGLARELGADIIFFKPDKKTNKDGIYYKDFSLICLNDCVSAIRQCNALLHELGHCFCEHQYFSCHSSGYSYKQEHEADCYMIRYRADEWLSQFNWEPEQIDIHAFLDYFELSHKYYDTAFEIFKELLGNRAVNY